MVVVNFWATYCPYCLEDIEHLKELNEELRHDDFQIVGVSSDLREELDSLHRSRTYHGQRTLVKTPSSLALRTKLINFE